MTAGPGAEAEDAALQTLSAALARFRGEPRQALGLTARDDAAAARRAFMELCKRFHPAKFARFSAPTVRLANEVFLAIKRAYEQASVTPAAAAGAVPRPMSATPSGRINVVSDRPATTPPTTRLAPPPAGLRRATGPGSQTVPRVAAPAAPAVPAARAPAAAPPAPTPPPSAPPRPPRPPSAAEMAAAGTRGRDRFERALALLREQRFTEARTGFAELAAEAPTDTRYRSYLHYARGWEAFQLGKDAEARAEWQRALAIDPAHGLAKWALESTATAR